MKNIFTLLNEENSQKIIAIFEEKINDNGIWKGRTLSLLIPISEIIVYLRNSYDFILSPQSLDEILEFDNILALYENNVLPKSTHIKLENYLKSLPGYDFEKKEQSESTQENHGYIAMGISRIAKEIKYS